MTKLITFEKFDNEDAYQIGCKLVEKVKNENLKNIRIRVVLGCDIVFQYLMNGKSGDTWLNRKQNTVELFKLPSYQVWQENETSHCYEQYVNDERYAICGGGYPIVVDDNMIGSIIVSGLAHDEDHQIIVDVINEHMLNKH